MQRMIRFRQTNNKPFTSETILDYVLQMCLGLAHIHKKNVIHRDIKPSNVFVTRANVLKIGDFGISKSLARANELTQTTVGTPYYVSPEKLRGKPYGSKSDMWALGCLIYELCTFSPPFRGHDMKSLSTSILRSATPRIPPKYGKFLDVCVRALLQKDPTKRPSAERILKTRVMQSRLMFHSTRFQKQVSVAKKKKSIVKKVSPKKVRPAPYRFGNEKSPSQNSAKPRSETPSPERRARWAKPRNVPGWAGARNQPKPKSNPATPRSHAWNGGTPPVDDAPQVIHHMRQHIACEKKSESPKRDGLDLNVGANEPNHFDHKNVRQGRAEEKRFVAPSPLRSPQTHEDTPSQFETMIASKIKQRMIGLERTLKPSELYISLGYLRRYANPGADRTKPSTDSMKVELVEKFFLTWHPDWTWDMKWECAAELVDIITLEEKLISQYN